ncbi:MAG: tRNA (adenosine(37)-N6)-dimethylallyltransferase MiaA [Alphaproteobacteria bacterium]|nr:tRNA (adenosine(37)-N6)-dimethylallyltransferase MiaA [Alphaproteobacteria bacterium]
MHTAPIIVIAGPTASGKSHVATVVADCANGVIINADSMQIYRELRVLSARPSAAEERLHDYRLYGVLPASERCSAGRWLALAKSEIDAVHASGKVPVVVGGTGLYLGALLHGIAPIPEVSPEVEREAARLLEEVGMAEFFLRLKAMDPLAGERCPPDNPQRLLRVWSVLQQTGRSFYAWHDEPHIRHYAPEQCYTVVVDRPRDELYARCDARFAQMMKQGALEEVRALLALALDPALPAMRAIGVEALGRFLRREIPLETAVSGAQQETRNYAKRQMTWFRHQLPDVPRLVLREGDNGPALEALLSEIRRFLTGFC